MNKVRKEQILMMKKLIIFLILCALCAQPAFAYNYTFSSGADTLNIFDKTTDKNDYYDDVNVRRNKDVTYYPPEYGVFSGNIPTDKTSLYHDYNNNTQSNTTSGTAVVTYSNAESTDYSGFLPPTSVYADEPAQTLPLYYSDGSIGKLEFPKFGKTIKVYEGESMENMRLGAGHMSGTSAWDGNCVIAAHNRGVPNNFSFLKNMNVGDKVKYTSQYGTRTYEVVTKTQIAVDDLSCLEWSAENILSLLTCVEGVPEKRLLVVCIEIVN